MLLALISSGLLSSAPVPARLAEEKVGPLAVTDSTEIVIRQLARALFLRGVFGVEEIDGENQRVSIFGGASTVGDVLDRICKQEPKYRRVVTDDPRMINLLPVDRNTPAGRILAYQLPEFDVEKDVGPDEVIRKLQDYSPALREFLVKSYSTAGGKDFSGGNAVSGFSGDARVPHVSVHLKNVSVLQILNAIALQSLDLYQAIGIDPRMVSTHKDLRVSPTGWALHFGNPKETPFLLWSYQVFVALQ